jgi:hypothetical protein
MGWEESTPLEQDQIRSQDKALDLPRPLNFVLFNPIAKTSRGSSVAA